MTKEFNYCGTAYVFTATTTKHRTGAFRNSYSVQQKERDIRRMYHWKTKEHTYNLDVTPSYFLNNDYPNSGVYNIETEFRSLEQAEARYGKIFDLACKGIFTSWEENDAFKTKDEPR